MKSAKNRLTESKISQARYIESTEKAIVTTMFHKISRQYIPSTAGGEWSSIISRLTFLKKEREKKVAWRIKVGCRHAIVSNPMAQRPSRWMRGMMSWNRENHHDGRDTVCMHVRDEAWEIKGEDQTLPLSTPNIEKNWKGRRSYASPNNLDCIFRIVGYS